MDALGVAEGGGVSSGVGVGDAFFFRWLEGLEVGEGDSVLAADARFFFGEALGVGDGEPSATGECLFFGDGEGAGDDFFSGEAAFFFRCGVGVGVEKIFLRVLPNDSSAASTDGTAMARQATKIRARKIM